MQTTVSVVIPTYNRLPYLREAVDSVLNQTWPALEILIVDDGSTDGTEEALPTFGGPVRYFRQKNSGPATARNRGIREAKGDWIAFLDSDDLWLPDKLAANGIAKENPEVEFLFAHMVLCWPKFEADAPEILDPAVNRYCQSHATNLEELLEFLLTVNPIPTSSVIFRKNVMDPRKLHILSDKGRWLAKVLVAFARAVRNGAAGDRRKQTSSEREAPAPARLAAQPANVLNRDCPCEIRQKTSERPKKRLAGSRQSCDAHPKRLRRPVIIRHHNDAFYTALSSRYSNFDVVSFLRSLHDIECNRSPWRFDSS